MTNRNEYDVQLFTKREVNRKYVSLAARCIDINCQRGLCYMHHAHNNNANDMEFAAIFPLNRILPWLKGMFTTSCSTWNLLVLYTLSELIMLPAQSPKKVAC